MAIPYRDILLWGHSLDNYINMFGLTEAELKLPILDCCGGPASFNAELTALGGQVISCDPLFALNSKDIVDNIEAGFAEMLQIVTTHKDRFVWDKIQSPQELAKIRRQNITIFLKDFPQGLLSGRYLAESPPKLYFQHFQFELALCSHFLFANSPKQTVDYHLAAISNLADIAKEVRIFPLLDSMGEIPSLVGAVTQSLYERGLGVEIRAVPYEFQKKGNAMLRVWAQTCEI